MTLNFISFAGTPPRIDFMKTEAMKLNIQTMKEVST